MRVLFCGDAAGTGFGTVTKDLGTALLERDLDVRFLAMNEQPGGDLGEPFEGRTALLGDESGWLAMTNPETSARLESMVTGGLFEDGWAPDVLLILGDPGSLDVSPILRFIPQGFPAFHYVPIEGVGIPPAWSVLWQRVTPVAMSAFGADQIEGLGLPRPEVVYHGVSGTDFWPVSAIRPIYMPTKQGLVKLHSKADCKRFFGADPERVWLLRTDRFMPRKMYGSLLRAVMPVLAANEAVDLVLNVREFDEGGKLVNELSKYGQLATRVHPTGFAGAADRRVLNALYNAADVYVTSSAEGFGLCIAEALMCAVPVVGMDYSAVPEVIGEAGVTVPVGALIDNIYGYFWARPDEPKFSAAVAALVADPAQRKALGDRGPDHVRRSFRWDTAARQFADLFAAVTLQEVAA